MSRVLVLNL